MQELDDIVLLREYAEHDSESAFATLVTRHIDRVYSVALRHTRNPHQAEEITQAVFVILAQKSKQLRKGVILEGWLYQTARLTALTHIRSEIRRARREQEAYMQTTLNENESQAWKEIAPLLDAALAGLNETDRNAVVLRFFYGKSMGEIGTALGANEDTARMRINRAIEKLQKFFSKRGVNSTADAITGAISVHSIQAAPAILAKAVTAAAVAKGATASASTLTLIKGALKLMAWTKTKTSIVASAAVLFVFGATTVAFFLLRDPQHAALAEGRRTIAKHIAEPLDMTGHFSTSASSFENGVGAWPAAPSGFQTFAHVPLQIDGAIWLWGSANTSRGQVFKEQELGIPVNRKFETLYVYHTTFYASPAETPVYELVFRYEDGSSVTNRMVYGVDLLNWYGRPNETKVSPSSPNSMLAWHGRFSSGGKVQPQMLRFFLTAIENPQPSITVTAIDLYSSKQTSAAVILAMTAGRSGLMH